MSEQHDAQTPEARAEATARDLADRGKAVTARAVREAAGVRMAVAAAAARAWREATTDRAEVEVPEIPEDVAGRVSAIWADAYRAAVAAVTPERDRFATEAEEMRAEVEALTATVSEVEDQRDQATQQAQEARDAQHATEEQLREANQSLSSRDASITELREQNRTLTGQLDALIARIPTGGQNTKDQKVKEQS